ncbi:MAG: hypothetical protein WAL16_07910 [Streptosporangiaceae bacterium]
MAVAVGSALLGLLIATLAIGIPRWINNRSLRSQPHDMFERDTYEQATGRSAADIAADVPGTTSTRSNGTGELPAGARTGNHQEQPGYQEPEA